MVRTMWFVVHIYSVARFYGARESAVRSNLVRWVKYVFEAVQLALSSDTISARLLARFRRQKALGRGRWNSIQGDGDIRHIPVGEAPQLGWTSGTLAAWVCFPAHTHTGSPDLAPCCEQTAQRGALHPYAERCSGSLSSR